ncbi:hypothetical protein IP90_00022 [Luteimonas cucumeris]|uniref:Uncharacterized protein n=1 Tax=Luteimonas cucumeris TaxID=985012 RepID=A0A562LDX9_9GAMM|nr:hypothetical protein [Luteimonas cucumeris]TWI05766.1 hypothetical protein IP90_00022 [Luteimonas cucumeris]
MIVTTAASDATDVFGVLALEFMPGVQPAQPALSQADAGRLAGLLGRDLAALVPDVRGLELAFAAAHFDPAEVLRPGWVLHRRLDELRQRAPQRNDGPRLIAFGADASGQVPLPFHADPDLHGGSLRVLPFLLVGDAALAQAVAAEFEEILLDRGMAQADAALCAQEGFGSRIEHARYLTVHDLAAMTALQYRNQGLEALWPLIETALLAPQREAWLDAPPEPLLRYVRGEVNIALFSPDTWRQRYLADAAVDTNALMRRFAHFEARQRQIAAVLQAHGVPVTFVHCNGKAAEEL